MLYACCYCYCCCCCCCCQYADAVLKCFANSAAILVVSAANSAVFGHSFGAVQACGAALAVGAMLGYTLD